MKFSQAPSKVEVLNYKTTFLATLNLWLLSSAWFKLKILLHQFVTLYVSAYIFVKHTINIFFLIFYL